jgi:4-amino-4-deoxy-L-arabinose transferase-like glycosyltransferase
LTGPAAGEPDRGRRGPTRSTVDREAVGGILGLLALGLAFRLIIAYLLPGSGFKVDVDAFRYWADNLASQGLYGFYDRPFFHDYTPGYLYVLWLVGLIGHVLGGIGDLIKLPPVLADLALAVVVRSMALELGASRRAARLAAIVILFNPVTWFDSVVWGQVDSVGVVFLLLAIRELWRDRPERSAVLTVVAAIIKPQLGILVPVVAAVMIRRALMPRRGFGDEEPPEPGATTTAWEARVRGWIRIVTTGAAGLATAIVVSLPFGLSLPGLVTQIFKTAGGYPYLSVNAWNPWALLSLDGRGVAESGQWVCDIAVRPSGPLTIGPFTIVGAQTQTCEPAFTFGGVPAVAVGAVLLLAVFIAVLWVVASRPDRRTILVGTTVLAIAFFVVPTRVHERYLFPLVALGLIAAAVSLRWRIAYALACVAMFANMYTVLTTLYPNNPSISDWLGIGQTLRSWPVVALASATQLGVFLWSLTELRASATRRLARVAGRTGGWARRDDAEVGRPRLAAGESGAEGVTWSAAGGGDGDSPLDTDGASAGGPDGAIGAIAGAAVTGAAAGVAERGGPATGRLRPIWYARPSSLVEGLWGSFRARLEDTPVRPDRSAELGREGGGRLDRLDLWVVVFLAISLLTVRIWRLSEPYRMHFDEVYHARTATEFLQDWRYGMSHDIYEWTHPHLAKYVMALGIAAYGNDVTAATSDLGVSVTGAAVEPRWEDTTREGARLGDRLWVTTGTEVRAYDLTTRQLIATVPVAGAAAVAIDRIGHRAIVGTTDGRVMTIATRPLDDLRIAGSGTAEPVELASLDGAIRIVATAADGRSIVAILADDTVVSVDAASGAELGRVVVTGATQVAPAGTGPALLAHPAAVVDVDATAQRLAGITGGDAATIRGQLSSSAASVVLGPAPTGDARTRYDSAVAAGQITGVEIGQVSRIAIAGDQGVTFLTPDGGNAISTINVGGAAAGLALATGLDHDRLYVAVNAADGGHMARIATSGAGTEDGPRYEGQFRLPSTGGLVFWDDATQMVHVVGGQPADPGILRPDCPSCPATVYVIEPHGDAVFADAELSASPAAVVLDANGRYPATDREELLAFSGDGTVASIDTGRHDFAWRLPGVIAGVLMALLLYILTRLLFRRRSIALLVAFLSLADGMLFTQSRIGMNDAYVGLFILLAYVLFAAIWHRPRSGRRAWLAFGLIMPAIGLSLGLALAAKWVAAYAIGALGILALVRSALGRIILLAGLILATTALGYMGIWVPEGQSGGNLLFLLVMIGLTLGAVATTVLHPIAWSWAEYRLAVAGPAVAGGAVILGSLILGRAESRIAVGSVVSVGPLEAGFLLFLLSGVVYTVFVLAGRRGIGPLAPPPEDDPVAAVDPPEPAPEGWLRLGAGFGLPAVWTLVCLVAVPIAVYVASYLPWAFVENHQLVPGWPPGHTGTTLVELTGQMYQYHNTLSAAHAASSPWWAWPFDFKPVWFYQDSFAGGTVGAIYDAGNLVLWWLGIPAMACLAWWSYTRRSAALALVAIGFACQWIAWARIDRAAFQYHYYTSLPFVIIGVAYFLAEIWHGATRRVWLIARLAAGAAILAPTLLWLLHRPLCAFVRVLDVNPGSQACPTLIPDFVLTARAAGLAIVIGAGVLILIRQMLALGDDEVSSRRWLPIAVTGALTVLGLIVVTAFTTDTPLISAQSVPVEPIALLGTVALVPIVVQATTVRDARRYVAGVVGAIGIWFVVWYPNISALPLPGPLSNAYQGLLPTYVYPFQFPVSTVNRTGPGPSLLGPEPMILLGSIVLASLVVAYSARTWRLTLAERRGAADSPDPDDAPDEAGRGAGPPAAAGEADPV